MNDDLKKPGELESLADRLRTAKNVVCFTGAGISTESGIADFRSPGGVWSRRQPVMYADFLRDPSARFEYWDQKLEAHDEFRQAQPNVAHRILAEWETAGRVLGVITQNIDGLHQDAGSRNVLELHGSARNIACLNCDFTEDADRLMRHFADIQQVPGCPDCGGLLKHTTISFGQSLDAGVLQAAADLAGAAEVLIVLGSSLVVEPAASIPSLAHHHGACLVIINRDRTPHDGLADFVFHQPIGQTVSELERLIGSASG